MAESSSGEKVAINKDSSNNRVETRKKGQSQESIDRRETDSQSQKANQA